MPNSRSRKPLVEDRLRRVRRDAARFGDQHRRLVSRGGTDEDSTTSGRSCCGSPASYRPSARDCSMPSALERHVRIALGDVDARQFLRRARDRARRCRRFRHDGPGGACSANPRTWHRR